MKTTNKILTIGDLKAFAKSRSRLNFKNYGQRELYVSDYNHIRRAQYHCKKHKLYNETDAPLVAGKYFYGRLIITKNSIEYIAGQYEPTEIWWAVLDYLVSIDR